MIKGSEIIGLPVIKLETGENLGKINDLFCNSILERVRAIQVLGKTEQELRSYSLSSVASFGRDAVLLKNAQLEEVSLSDEFLYSWTKLKGIKVLGCQGNELGILVDILFEVPLGSINGIEVSEGFIGDLISGRHIIAKDLVQTCNRETIIVGSKGCD